MIRKKRWLLITLPLFLILAACSSLKLPGTSSNANTSAGQNQQGQPGQPFDMSKQPIEQKLALGTLKLEGTDKAVTEEQAKELLPLWKAAKTLSSSSNTSQEEINAVYKQIQDAMTADQVQTIKDLNLSQADLQALMKQYGIQAPQMGARPNGTPVARGTQRAQSGSNQNQGGGFPGGPGGDFSGPPPDGGGFPGSAQGQANAQGTPRVMGTRPAGMRGGFGGGMNMIYIDPLIKVLQQRSGIQLTPTPAAQ